MSRLLFALSLMLALAVSIQAAEKPTEIPLWPGVAPGEKGNIPEEKFAEPKAGENPPLKRLGNVSKPTITVYRPDSDKNTGAAVVIAPGGGYNILAWEHEGTQVAEWLQSIGVTAIVLKYRVPRRPDSPKDEPPLGALQDAQRAISVVRSRAKEWAVDPARVGMLGFSAGGHLAVWTATNFDKRSYEAVDDSDKASARPDFLIPIYPGGILVRGTKDQVRPEIRITKETPPSFLVVAYNDAGSFDSTVHLLRAMKDAGVNAELHVYSSGGHGFGMKPSTQPFATWPKRVEDWMRVQGYLTVKK